MFKIVIVDMLIGAQIISQQYEHVSVDLLHAGEGVLLTTTGS